MKATQVYVELSWRDQLIKATNHIEHPKELILSVIDKDTMSVFEAKGGNESIYYHIKGFIDSYCYFVSGTTDRLTEDELTNYLKSITT